MLVLISYNLPSTLRKVRITIVPNLETEKPKLYKIGRILPELANVRAELQSCCANSQDWPVCSFWVLCQLCAGDSCHGHALSCHLRTLILQKGDSRAATPGSCPFTFKAPALSSPTP